MPDTSFGEPGTGGPGGGFGEPGRNGQPGQPAAPNGEASAPPEDGAPPLGDRPLGDRPQGGGGGFGRGDFTTENPMWVAATITFEGRTWTKAGVRYKGNSSLMSAWRNGSEKLPFKLDFDEFEDDYPEIENQRFYGFQQLSLSNSFSDGTYMRDTITYDLLEKAGLVAAETAYYEVVLDHGDGPVSLGLYAAVEVIDDTVIERAFEDDSGNIYEADGRAASLAAGTADQIQESFQKENNEAAADWSDIEELYTVVHSEERTTDPEGWRAKLEAIFDVDTFLEWLALSAVIQHWDTYGGMTHNYYLYDDPSSGQLTWISWDHNMVLGGMGGGPGDGRGRRSTSFDKVDVGENWPLIRYLLDDPTYYEAYVGYVQETTSSVVNADELAKQYQDLAALIRPYAAEDNGETAFDSAVEELMERTYERAKAATEFLATQ